MVVQSHYVPDQGPKGLDSVLRESPRHGSEFSTMFLHVYSLIVFPIFRFPFEAVMIGNLTKC